MKRLEHQLSSNFHQSCSNHLIKLIAVLQVLKQIYLTLKIYLEISAKNRKYRVPAMDNFSPQALHLSSKFPFNSFFQNGVDFIFNWNIPTQAVMIPTVTCIL